MTMEPFVALMRRYCIDYTNVHDQSVCDEIMVPGYVVHVSGATLGMPDYTEAVTAAYRRFPTLGLTVHELVTNGQRLAMRFSEHGASARHDGRLAVWQGISLYAWDGSRLTECFVEQDFLATQHQLASGTTYPLEPPHPDPWLTTVAEPVDREAEETATAWLDAFGEGGDREALETPGFRAAIDDSAVIGGSEPILLPASVEIDSVFSAGDRVAARLTLRGPYAGGLRDVPEARVGTPGWMHATFLARLEGDRLAVVHMIRDRWSLRRRLLAEEDAPS